MAAKEPSPEARRAQDVASVPGAFQRSSPRSFDPRIARYVPGELLVRFKPGTSAAERKGVREQEGAKLEKALPVSGLQLVKVKPGTSVRAAEASFERRGEVLYAQPNFYRHATGIPNDPRFADLWGLNNTGQSVAGQSGKPDADIDAPEAWNVTTGSPSVTVAVVDTGVDIGNPELSPGGWTNPGESGGGKESNGVDDDGNGLVDDWRGWDWVNSDNNPDDENGHGTHVAGTIGARGNNANGVAGVDWQARIMPLRVLDAGGSGTDADIAAAFRYAGLKGAKVVNASLGGEGASPAITDAITSSPGTLFVAAAGNDRVGDVGGNNDVVPQWPCNVPADNVVCVAATDSSDQLADFSNYGASSVDLAAPGTEILSTYPFAAVFSDDFETPLSGRWATGGVNNTWGRTTEASASGTHSLADSPGGNYKDNTDSFARTGALNLGGRTGCGLDYLTLLDFPDGLDYLAIEASTDGSNWTELAAYTGSGAAALRDDLSAFNGRSSVYVRYHLVSNAAIQGDGAYIDDVELNCKGHGLRFLQGTSMATPHVAGVAALVWAFLPSSSVANVKKALLDGTDRIDALAGRTVSGGRLNAFGALREADVRAPETSLSGPAYENGAARFDFSSDKPNGASFECRVDSAASWQRCSSPTRISGLSDGDHRFEVRAFDAFGRVDPTPAAAGFDGDGRTGAADNCPAAVNPDQADADADGVGDACDDDADNDGWVNSTDNCPTVANSNQANNDGDPIGDACDVDDDNDFVDDSVDNCPFVANADQRDGELDRRGDACDSDDDNDGLSDADEGRRGTSRLDKDSDDDGLDDRREVRSTRTNPRRFDSDRDGLSDGLELGLTLGVADPPGTARGTNKRYFRADRDPRTKTRPTRRDNDADGMRDGLDRRPLDRRRH